MSYARLRLVMLYAGWPHYEIDFRIAGVWPAEWKW